MTWPPQVSLTPLLQLLQLQFPEPALALCFATRPRANSPGQLAESTQSNASFDLAEDRACRERVVDVVDLQIRQVVAHTANAGPDIIPRTLLCLEWRICQYAYR